MFKGAFNRRSILFFIVVLIALDCKKDSHKKPCPLQDYTIECTIRDWDIEFDGYDTGTDKYTVQANCPEDAQKIAADMSYDFGEVYKHCHVVQ